MQRVFIVNDNVDYQQLDDAETKIQLAGFTACSFLQTDRYKADIIRKLTECDGVYILNNNSNLTKLEIEIAKELKLDFYTDEQLEEICSIREIAKQAEEKAYMQYLETQN